MTTYTISHPSHVQKYIIFFKIVIIYQKICKKTLSLHYHKTHYPLTMKKIVIVLVLLACTISMSAQGTKSKKSDPIRQQLTWLPYTAYTNDEGEIEWLTLAYEMPNGDEHNFLCELPWPVAEDQFVGGDIEEEDINFDGIPDLQISLGFTNSTGHNAMYTWYVWDTKSHSFIEVEEPLIISPMIDRKHKSITTRMINDKTATYEQYKWKKGKMVKIDEWTEEVDY